MGMTKAFQSILGNVPNEAKPGLSSGDLLSITRQVVDSSASWNEAALSLGSAASVTQSSSAFDHLLPDDILFTHESDARKMTTQEWNELALSPPKRAP